MSIGFLHNPSTYPSSIFIVTFSSPCRLSSTTACPPPPPSHRHFNRSIPKIFPLIQLAFPLRINHINSTSIELFSLRAFSLSHFPPFPCAPIFRFIFGQLPDPCAPRPLPCPVLLSRPRPVPSLPFDDLPTPLLFCFHFYFLSFSPVSLPSL